jgi:hypothetical protein
VAGDIVFTADIPALSRLCRVYTAAL